MSFEKGINKNTDGTPRRISIFQEIYGHFMEVLHFHNFKWKQKTVSEALSQAGFSSVEFGIAKVSEDGIKKLGSDFWKLYNKDPSVSTTFARRK